jgi:ribose transport system permease protein
VLRNGLNLLSVSAFWQQVVIGVVIALAVLLDTARRKAGAGTPAAGAGTPGGRKKQAATYVLAAVVTVAVVGATSFLHGGSDAAKNPKVGLSLSTLNNPFFVQIRSGAQAEAKKRGVDLTVTDAQNDASQQANQLQNFTSSSYGAIIVNPVDSDAAAPSVRAADKADIPVVAVDRGVNKAETKTLVASDNVAGGELAAKTVAEKLGGSGKIVILQGQAGTSAARERAEGFAKGLKAYPGIKVLAQQPADFDRTKGLDVMSNLLQAHPDVQGVIAANDEMALGAIKALGSKAGKSVAVVGFDGTPDGLKAVQDGTLYASVAQQPSQLGRIAVDNALRAVDGKKVDATVKVPVKVVTKKNVAGFTG